MRRRSQLLARATWIRHGAKNKTNYLTPWTNQIFLAPSTLPRLSRVYPCIFSLRISDADDGDDDVFEDIGIDFTEPASKRRTQSLSALPKDDLKSPKKVRFSISIHF